jgi:serine/threonine protein kinase/ABC-type branched-subunit amino acid transport system substrate-binding protein
MSAFTDQQLKHGDIVDNRYVIDDYLGGGGFGHVYRGRQLSTGQKVAIKVLLTERLASGRHQVEFARFDREVQFIASLHHPNIVRLIDSGKIGEEMLYMVLEYIDGQTLADIIASQEKISLSVVTELMLQVLDALACAHEQGVVHRDLKPANIMIMRTGVRYNAKILDFGISSIVDSARDASYQTLTSMEEVFGTAPYMAPEQVCKVAVTEQTDIYAWGLIFIEACTGKSAIPPGSPLDQAQWQASAEPVPIPPEIEHRTVRKVLRKATAKPMAQRYKSAADVINDLRGPISLTFRQDHTDTSPDATHPFPRQAATTQKASSSHSVALWSGVALLIISTAAVWFILLYKPSEPTPSEHPVAPEPSPSRCTTHSACAALTPNTVCAPSGQCVPLTSRECQAYAGDPTHDRATILGLIGQLSLPTYRARQQAAILALQEINDAGGLLDGRKLVLLSCDDAANPAQGVRAAQHLASLGVPLILGPDHSSVLLSVATEVTLKAGIPLISAAATSPVLSDLNRDGLLWRLVPDDRLQASAIAAHIRSLSPKRVAIFARKGSYGASLLEALSADLDPSTLRASTYDDDPDPAVASAAHDALVSGLLSADTDMIVILGAAESGSILTACERHRAAQGWPPLPHGYLLSEAGFKPETLAAVAATPSLSGLVSIMELIDSESPHFGPFKLRYEATYGPLPTVGAKVSNAYDAAYIAAYALAALPATVTPNGKTLAAAIRALTRGAAVPVGPSSIGKARNILAANGELNLEGVSGPLDFNPVTGQTASAFRLQRVTLANGTPTTTPFARFDSTSMSWAPQP